MSSSRREKVMQLIEQLAPLLGQMEEQRKQVLQRVARARVGMVIAGGCWIVVLLLLVNASDLGLFALIVPAVGFSLSMLLIRWICVGNREKQYVFEYKQRVLREVTRAIYPEMRYQPAHGVSKSMFQSSGLHESRIDRYHSEDFFTGKVGETEVFFSEVKAEREDTHTDSKGNSSSTWVTVFDGVFFAADFHKEFSTWVTVLPDFAEKSFGWLGRKLQRLGGASLVRLESPEFENAFVVRSGDQVAARYILTPDMQERLLELRRFHGVSLRLIFRDSRVFLTFDVRENWFEPKLANASYDVRQIERFVLELQACCEIVEMLNLNTRIWTK